MERKRREPSSTGYRSLCVRQCTHTVAPNSWDVKSASVVVFIRLPTTIKELARGTIPYATSRNINPHVSLNSPFFPSVIRSRRQSPGGNRSHRFLSLNSPISKDFPPLDLRNYYRESMPFLVNKIRYDLRSKSDSEDPGNKENSKPNFAQISRQKHCESGSDANAWWLRISR